MSRYIDADEIENAKFQEENLRGMGDHIAYRIGWNEAIESISENAPSIEIVHCGECRWGKPYSDKQLECDALGLGGLKFPDDFCSYGECSEKPNNSKVSEKPTGSERSSE